MDQSNHRDFLPLSSPIKELRRIAPFYAQRLKKMRIETLGDLLFHVPHRYEDFSRVVPIAQAQLDTPLTIEGAVVSTHHRRIPYRRLQITEAIIGDESGRIKAVWFNQPHLAERLRKGTSLRVSGTVTKRRGELVMTHPLHEIISQPAAIRHAKPREENIHTGRLIAIYPETAGVSSRWFRYIISHYLQRIPPLHEFLPRNIIARHSLIPMRRLLAALHFPSSHKEADAAKKRIVFNQLLLLQLLLLQTRKKIQSFRGPSIPRDIAKIRAFVQKLPYTLTFAQRRSLWEITSDLRGSAPMNRLLEGDVGSGKTVVAAGAADLTVRGGYQTALLAPTEILASQHFHTFTCLTDVPIMLLTNTLRAHSKEKKTTKEQILRAAREGMPGIFIGTHALIQDAMRFGRLGLVVVDEQHRFGVQHRKRLLAAHAANRALPHLLSMSATPIPRTLAMTLYGDLDISILDEVPAGRGEIQTEIISAASDRKRIYEHMRREMRAGRQAYIICPRIEKEEEENGNWLFPPAGNGRMKNIAEVYEALSKNVFPEFSVAPLHGKMPPREKEGTMKNFIDANVQILVSTSVVEVGVDVPNATLMLVESADRFGLAQLYQLRGRIGRGKNKSYCYYATELQSRKARARLNAILTAKNGFELAEEDLRIRGPGEFFGTQQSGLPDIATSNLMNAPLVYAARKEADAFLKKDAALKNYPLLQKELEKFRRHFHRE